ncbi:MAG: 23S rRNA (adenine(2503)-C(2))-methyltransferase RlmN [Firmicutes bacterium]|nr:23S rRNA (adenine(2503)-C(2))-methyltransferase RlmN [Bacillota bacterium]
MENMGKIQIAGLFPDEIAAWLADYDTASYRADQIFHWIHHQQVNEFVEMSNIPNKVIELLETQCHQPLAVEEVVTRKSIDGTEKYLFRLEDHETIETVLIPDGNRNTVCVSSQVGCAMNCSFCATGQGGCVRNMTGAEIVSQVLWVQRRLKRENSSISNIVFMGMGEPFANYREVMKSIHLINHPDGLNLGMRRITISTCGLVPQIERFARENTQANLAVSLHAPIDSKRSQIMPINKKYPIEQLIDACSYYVEQTGRRISFEYALIDGFNDSTEDALQLRDLLSDLLCHVNLIPINPVNHLRRSKSQVIQTFAQVLEDAHISVTIRKERGTDIEAACGQLRQRS